MIVSKTFSCILALFTVGSTGLYSQVEPAAPGLAPNGPKAASESEFHSTWEGPVETAIIDYPDGSHKTFRWINAGGQHLELHLAGAEPAGYQSGAVLRATGTKIDNRIVASTARILAAASTAASSNSTAVSACSTSGVQNTAVLLVTFPGVALPAGVTPQNLNDIFFGTGTGVSVDGFLQAASYGQTWATGSVFGTFTLTGAYKSCSDVGGAVLNDAITAAIASGVNLNSYSRIFIVFPDIFGCGWSGYTSLGGCSTVSSSGSFNATTSYLSATFMASRSQGMGIAAHELGHNFGLLHSGTLSAGADVLGPLTSPGTLVDMGDLWSVMGQQVIGLYPAPQKAEVLGWMSPTTNYQVVQSSGTYTLQPLEMSPAGLQALKVQRGTGNNAWLWIEYRQPIGSYDSTLMPQPFSGALIHYEDPNTPVGHTYLPNFSPTDTSGFSPALPAGQTWTDPYSNLSLSVLSATPSGLTVGVNYGATPCTHANPNVSITPANAGVSAGSSVNYSISVTNNDSSGCSASTFGLASTQPSGWNGSLSSNSLTLNPGQTSSATLVETVPATTASGTFSVNASASSSSYTASATALCTVSAAPTLTNTLSLSGSSFSLRQTVTMTAKVLYGGSAASGATVTFTLAKANGSTVTGTATTNSTGQATWSYKLGPKDPRGTYSSTSKASYNSQTASSALLTFTVQ